MKKRILGVIAAAFLFVALLPLTASAANTAYAILYEDGTLVFQNSNTPESGRAVKKTYAVNLTAHYTGYPSDFAPWYNESNSIRIVDFASVVRPTSTAHWFHNCYDLERVDNIRNLDTSNVANMEHMFHYCSSLKAIDVSSWNTAKVTSMDEMFSSCEDLTELDLSHWNTSNVTSMSLMFGHCGKLQMVNMSGFDTSRVEDMSAMFLSCQALTALDLSSFDTSKVKLMHMMFENCSGLKTIYVSDKFTTASISNDSDMFSGCTSLVGGNGTKRTYSQRGRQAP